MKTVLLFLLLSPTILLAQLINVTPQDVERKQSYLLFRDGTVLRGRIIRQDSTVITVQKRNGDRSFVEADQVVSISPNRPDRPPGSGLTPTTVFVLKDGTRFSGKFIRRDSTMITVRKSNGQLTYFEPELLARVDSSGSDTEAVLLANQPGRTFSNRFSPWLLTGNTAFNAEKGRFYYRNTFLLLNEFQYGLTRNLSLGVSINPFFGSYSPNDFSPRETVLGATVRFSGKLTFPIGEQFRFGINTIYQPRQKGYYFQLAQQLTIQGLMSFGDSQRNATLGYGLRIFPDYISSNKIPVITVGVMHKISHNLTFLSDNTFYLNAYYGNSSAELSAALRLNRKRHAFDLGALATVRANYIYYASYPAQNRTSVYFSPYIGYNLIIGRN
ncbi:hypothetical protein [Spirosoma fluviale]|uniref:Outer membrane protein beta-barrel family protein n=1 Tax=Spirosoma fluviale TaxID=1597977 RepID=A0A286FC31_9BACT|nr:hypothetical protein [Spirosoma fluviale]SOD80743.1 hypothetical protein SAMN06269250_1552 [Spirosoma fluviale]